MSKERDIPGEMEEGQNYTNHETGYTNVRRSNQISPHNPSKFGRENTGNGTDKQNKPLHVFNGVPQQKSVLIHSQTSRADAIMSLKDFAQEVISKGEIIVIVIFDLDGAFKFACAPSVLKIYKKADVHVIYTTSQKITSAKEEQTWQQTTSNWREQ